MKKLFIFAFVVGVIFFVAQNGVVHAENGCGGTEFCQDTKIVNQYECTVTSDDPPSCNKVYSGPGSISCTATQDECYGTAHDTRCRFSQQLNDCYDSGGNDRVSCCSGAGGGNYECENPTIVKECISSSECPPERRGATCAPGKKWCFQLQCAACTATAPVISPITTTATTATISWTGTGGTIYRLYVCSDSSYTNCVLNGTTETSPKTVDNLTAGTHYYVKIVNYKDAACSAEATTDFTTSCVLIAPPSLSLNVGDPPQDFAVNLNPADAGLVVDFTTDPAGIIDLSPAQGNLANGYQTTVTATSAGPTTLTSSVAGSCQAQTLVDVASNNSGAWWQTKDADLSANGDINSSVPDGQYFDVAGTGGYPGVPTYSGSTNLTSSNVSLNQKWLAQSAAANSKIYDYQFFANQVPTDTMITTIPNGNVDGSFFESGGTPSYGYYWYRYIGSGTNLSLDTSINLTGTDRKVILLVEGVGLTIKGNINLADGQEFFGAFVNGAIDVDPLVTSLEGIYLADSTFGTGTGNTNLSVRGSIATYGGIFLQRDLETGIGNGGPAELFEYAPDQILMFPTKLGARKISWKEVAP